MPNRRDFSFDPAITVDLRPTDPEPNIEPGRHRPAPRVGPDPDPTPGPEVPTHAPIRRSWPASAQLDGLVGLCILVIVTTGLGLPLPGGHLAVDAVLVITGYQLGLGVLRLAGRSPRWIGRFWLSALGPIVLPTVLAVGLATATWWWLDRLGPAEFRGVLAALTMTANIVPLIVEADSPATNHLWLIGLIVQFALVCPLALALARRPGGPRLVLRLLVVLVAAVVSTRLTLTLVGVSGSSLTTVAVATRVDGLLIGLGVAFAPRSLLGRVPRAASGLALAGLLAGFALAPDPVDRPTVTLGLLAPVVALATAAIVAGRGRSSDSGSVAHILGHLGLRWLGERAVTLYVWHRLFGMALTERAEAADMFGADWPGFGLFITGLVFALAAGAASYRYLQLPLRNLAWRTLTDQQDRGRAATDNDEQQHPGEGALPLTA